MDGFDLLRAAVIEQTKKDYMRAVPKGISEKRIEADVMSRYWAQVILGGVVDGEEVLTAWRAEKNSQY